MDGQGSALPPGSGVAMVPGWYPDSARSDEQRYWTGASWSGRRRWADEGWLRVADPPETESPGRPDPPRSRRPWWIAAAAVSVAAGTAGACTAGAFSPGTPVPAPPSLAAVPATLRGIETSPALSDPGPARVPPAADGPESCTVWTPSDAYPVSGRGIDAVKSTLPSQSYTVRVVGGLVGAAVTYAGTTDASGNGLGSFTVPDLGQAGSIVVSFASGTSCRSTFVVGANK